MTPDERVRMTFLCEQIAQEHTRRRFDSRSNHRAAEGNGNLKFLSVVWWVRYLSTRFFISSSPTVPYVTGTMVVCTTIMGRANLPSLDGFPLGPSSSGEGWRPSYFVVKKRAANYLVDKKVARRFSGSWRMGCCATRQRCLHIKIVPQSLELSKMLLMAV